MKRDFIYVNERQTKQKKLNTIPQFLLLIFTMLNKLLMVCINKLQNIQ